MSQRQPKTPIHHEVGIPEKIKSLKKRGLTSKVTYAIF